MGGKEKSERGSRRKRGSEGKGKREGLKEEGCGLHSRGKIFRENMNGYNMG
jgi:hypothetical protein